MEMQIHYHFHFSPFLHRLKTSSNAPSCGPRINVLLLTSRSGRANAIITVEFVSLMRLLIFIHTQRHFLWLVCLIATTNLVLMLPLFPSDLTIIQKCASD